MAEWLKGCEVCNAGLCAHVDELRGDGHSIRSAVKILETEQKEKFGEVVFGWSGLFKRYLRNKNKSAKVIPNGITQSDTCAVSDLSFLIKSGRKFGTIYADPPWSYSNQGTRAATNNHYSTLSVDEIASIPVNQLVADKAHLHLWTTNAFLFECPKILEAWGFEYKGVFVWVKPQMGIGNYWRVSHEFMVLGVRGGLTFSNHSQMSWLRADRTKHSSKPEDVYSIIESVSPGPHLEMFGRKTRPHWTVWGNEIKRELFNAEAFNEAGLQN